MFQRKVNEGAWGGSVARSRRSRRVDRRRRIGLGAPGFEALEPRTLMAAFTVTNLDDAGAGSLREAIASANANADADTIGFQGGLTGTITLTSGELAITKPVTITGSGAGALTISGNNASRVFNVNDTTGAAVAVTLEGLTISGGNAVGGFGGGLLNSENLTIRNCTISGNTADFGGGVENSGALTLVHSTVSGNTATLDGGGVSQYAGTLTIQNSTISNNRSDSDGNEFGSGGGIRTTSGTIVLTSTIVAGNFRGSGSVASDIAGSAVTGSHNLIGDLLTSGGLVHGENNNLVAVDPMLGVLADNGGPTRTHALLAGSPAINAGSNPSSLLNDQRGTPFGRASGQIDIGAYEVQMLTLTMDTLADENDGNYSTGDLSLREAIVLTNGNPGADLITFDASLIAGGPGTITLGGSELFIGGALTITGPGANLLTISGNNASRVFHVNDPTTQAIVTLEGLSIFGGSSSSSGGAIRSTESLTIRDSAIGGSTAVVDGGGVLNFGGSLTVVNSTLSGNMADFGGGVFNDAGTLIVRNSTISGNTALRDGGGIHNYRGDLTLSNSTVADNRADWDGNSSGTGGGVFHTTSYNSYTMTTYGSMVSQSSIVAGNFRGPGSAADDITGSGVTGSHNLIGDLLTSGGLVHGVDNNLVAVDPMLGVLANNGGPTRTHALLTGSQAINAGTDSSGLLFDQRSYPFTRASGQIDIGAFERQSLALVVDTVADEDDGDYDLGDLSLREAIGLTNANPGADTITFSASLTAGGPGTITLGGTALNPRDDLTVTGPGAYLLTISGNNASRVFDVNSPTRDGVLVTLEGLTISGGNGVGGVSIEGGGGIVTDEILTIRNSTVNGNTTTHNGGGVRVLNGTLIVENSTIRNNTAQDGGGVSNDNGTLALRNSTVSGNTGLRDGGGVHNAYGDLTLDNSTVTNNRSDSDGSGTGMGGGVSHTSSYNSYTLTSYGTMSSRSSIVAGNFNGSGPAASDIAGSGVTGTHNLVGVDTGLIGITNGSNNNQIGTAASPIFPQLGALADNGGPTQTHLLLAGSPAIDAGSNPLNLNFDQRGSGFPRTFGGGTDIGAYESTNQAPTDIALSSSSVAENQASGTVVGTIETTDPDVENTFTYTLVSGAGSTDNASFQIVANALQTNGVFDFETKNSYSVRVRSTDQGGLTFEKAFTITVTNVNETPTEIFTLNSSVMEGQPAGAYAAGLTTSDPDAGNTFTYSLVSGTGSTDNGSFQIVGDELRTNAVFDFETKSSYSVRLRTTDQGGLVYERQQTVTVLDANELPTDIGLSNNTIAENQASGTTVGVLSTTDPDAGNTFTYTLVSGAGDTNNALFNISGSSLRANASLDFEATPTLSVRVRSTDQGGLFVEEAFTITVTNANEVATDIGLSNNSVAENAGANATVGMLSTTDPDAGNTFTYTLVSGAGDTNNALFNITGSSLRANASLDFEATPTLSVRVRSTDQGGLFVEEAFTINVTDVNETAPNQAPTDIGLSNGTVAENAGANAVVGMLSSTDPDAGNIFTYTLESGAGDTGNALFNIVGSSLRATGSLDFESTPNLSVRVRTTDQGGLFFEEAFTITVTNVNEAPTAMGSVGNIVAENFPVGSVLTMITTIDPDAGDTFIYTLVSGTGSTDNASFQINGDLIETNAVFDFETKSSYSIRVRSTDQGGLFFEREYIQHVQDLNENPTDIGLSNSSVAENQPTGTTVGTLSSTDPDAGNTHTYALVSGAGDTDNGSFQIVGGALQTNGVFDFETKSSYSVRVRSTDQDGLTRQEVFTIGVTDVSEAGNDAPTDIGLSNSTVAENAGTNAVVGALSTTDADTGDTFTYTLVSGAGDTHNALFNISGSSLRASASLNFEATPSLTVRVRSTDQGGLFFEEAFTITVTNVNETPTDLGLSNSTVAENAGTNAVVGTFSTTDPDAGNTFTYTLVSGAGDTNNALFNISGSSLRASASLDFETTPSLSVRVRSTDQGGLFFEEAFTITMTNVNESPRVSDLRFLKAGSKLRGFVVDFDRDLNPATAQDLANYGVFKGAVPVLLTSAVYEDVNDTVTVLFTKKQKLNKFYRFFVDGTGSVTGANGEALDGEFNAAFPSGNGVEGGDFDATFGVGTKLVYRDAGLDKVTLKLKKGGLMRLVLDADTSGDAARLDLLDTVAGMSKLSGKVKRGNPAPPADGMTTIDLIAGVTGVNNLLLPPKFTVGGTV